MSAQPGSPDGDPAPAGRNPLHLLIAETLEFLRQAAAERAEETLAGRPSEQFADVAGVVHGGGGRARRTGQAFTESLATDRNGR